MQKKNSKKIIETKRSACVGGLFC